MKLFIDANVLVAVLNKEYPVFTVAARILSLNEKPGWKLYTSPLCIAIAWYFSSKKSGANQAARKIELLSRHIHITEMSATHVSAALHNKRIKDLEDGMEYYSAHEAGCDLIITEDISDFYFSELEVLDCNAFAKRFMQ